MKLFIIVPDGMVDHRHPRLNNQTAVECAHTPGMDSIVRRGQIGLLKSMYEGLPLGSLVGIYEGAVDQLATWEVDGKKVRPKVIASTATVRRAAAQVSALFNRQVRVFPPPGLEAGSNFFSRELPVSDAAPGRLYVGVCAPGRRLKPALIRVYVAALAAGQTLYEKYGEAADPFLTAVGYFSSLRELGGMRRLVDDDVRSLLTQIGSRGLKKRNLRLPHAVEELTSRKSATEIPEVLERMKCKFPPFGQQAPKPPIDVLLATNMLSVGVDVGRLGLMIVAGQPKSTSEYIQATSRVGRASPGMVITVANWSRPRDLTLRRFPGATAQNINLNVVKKGLRRADRHGRYRTSKRRVPEVLRLLFRATRLRGLVWCVHD